MYFSEVLKNKDYLINEYKSSVMQVVTNTYL
jgi:hypothetical protein